MRVSSGAFRDPTEPPARSALADRHLRDGDLGTGILRGHGTHRLVISQIRSGDVPESCPYQHVGRKMPFAGKTAETDSGRQPIGAPLKPAFVRVPVRENRGKGEARGSVPGGKRSHPPRTRLGY